MKIQINKINLGLRIQKIRQSKGYTLEEFGKLFNANKALVSKWVKGHNIPNSERIKAIAKLGDLTVNELLYGSIEEFVRTNYFNIVPETPYKKPNDGTILNIIDVAKIENKNINNIEGILGIAEFFFETEIEERIEGTEILQDLIGELSFEKQYEVAEYLLKKYYEDGHVLDDYREGIFLESFGLQVAVSDKGFSIHKIVYIDDEEENI